MAISLHGSVDCETPHGAPLYPTFLFPRWREQRIGNTSGIRKEAEKNTTIFCLRRRRRNYTILERNKEKFRECGVVCAGRLANKINVHTTARETRPDYGYNGK